MKVLLVDDDPDILKQGKLFLEEERDCLVLETASSGEEGLEKIKEENYDAVITDYQMPGMTGIELLRKLRKKGYGIPIIIFTGKGREELALKALKSGANRYFRKAGDPRTLYEILAQATIQEVRYHRMQNMIENGLGIYFPQESHNDHLEDTDHDRSDIGPNQKKAPHRVPSGIGKNVN